MRQRITAIVVPALLLAGCDLAGGGGDPDPQETPEPPEPPTPPGATASVAIGGARQVVEETDTFLFEFSYPLEAGQIPGLAEWLDAQLDRRRQALASRAAEGRDDARDNGFPFNQYSSGTAWEVVADTPGWLSLSANLDSYEGGAHPNYSFDAIVWDKTGERTLEPIAFFTSPAALDRVLGDRLCEALNAERAVRRGAPVPENSSDSFDTCVKPDETNLLLGSSDGRAFDRIGIQIAPYLAGPYAEGSYEFTFDVDAELLGIVRPEYREAFATP